MLLKTVPWLCERQPTSVPFAKQIQLPAARAQRALWAHGFGAGLVAIAATGHARLKPRSSAPKAKLQHSADSVAAASGYPCCLSELDYRVRAVPGEVTFIDPVDPREGAWIRPADAQASSAFLRQWAFALASEADWRFELCLPDPEAWLCRLQDYSQRETPATEVPWLLERFQTAGSICPGCGGPRNGIIVLSDVLADEAALLNFVRSIRRSERHAWILRRSDCDEQLRGALQNICDNNLCVWEDLPDPHGKSSASCNSIRVKVCSVRNHLAGRDDLCSFALERRRDQDPEPN